MFEVFISCAHWTVLPARWENLCGDLRSDICSRLNSNRSSD
jgi:hypothetical protein